jgi:hypothetical protein
MLEVVLNAWVTETKLVLAFSNTSTNFAKSKTRPCEPVDLVDCNNIDLFCFHVCEQGLQAGSLKGAARVSAIIVSPSDKRPAFGRLAFDVCRAGLALGIERIEFLIQSLVCRFARVYSAPKSLHADRADSTNPKNAGPDQRVPVISRATSLSERHFRSFQFKPPPSSTVTTCNAPFHSRTKRIPG